MSQVMSYDTLVAGAYASQSREVQQFINVNEVFKPAYFLSDLEMLVEAIHSQENESQLMAA